MSWRLSGCPQSNFALIEDLDFFIEVVFDSWTMSEPKPKKYRRQFKSKANQQRGSDARAVLAGKADKLLCKLAFLNGETDKIRLGEIGGCCEKTLLESWLPEFEREKKKMYLGFRNASFQLGVTESELTKHLDYIRHLEQVSEQYQSEIENYDDMRKSLKNIVLQLEGHPDFDDKDFKNITSLLSIFVTSKKAYDGTVNAYIKVTNEWADATGVKAHHSAAAGRLKEAERLRGKDDAGRNPLTPTSEGDDVAKSSQDPFFGGGK